MDTFFSILKVIGIILEVVLIFNLLIFVHELGHFLAAKWRGLYVEEFALWFGKPLWKKKIGGVTYAINCIPAGGYVKLPQMAPMESLEGKSEDLPPEARKPISALDKIIVAFAGPLFSFLLACVFAVIVWQIGRPMAERESSVVIGEVQKGSPAAEAGLLPGDEIVAVDDIRVNRFMGQGKDAILWRVVRSEGETVKFTVRRNGKEMDFNPAPRIPGTKFYERKGTRTVGIIPSVTPLIGKVEEGSPAAVAGLKKGDFITHVNGVQLYSEMGISEFVRDNPGVPTVLSVERGGKTIEVPFKLGLPKVSANGVVKDSPAEKAGLRGGDVIVSMDGKASGSTSSLMQYIGSRKDAAIDFVVRRGGGEEKLTIKPAFHADAQRFMVGAAFEDEDGITFDIYGRGRTVHPGPLEQIEISVGAIVNTIEAVASSKSDIKLQHMGGPVMMMNVYYRLFEQDDGWKLALWFSVLLNVNLALLNMLPLPVLDGGHITLAIVEALRRKPVNLRLLEWVQTACAMLIIGFMLYVTFYDTQDLFGGKDRNKFHYGTPPAENAK